MCTHFCKINFPVDFNKIKYVCSRIQQMQKDAGLILPKYGRSGTVYHYIMLYWSKIISTTETFSIRTAQKQKKWTPNASLIKLPKTVIWLIFTSVNLHTNQNKCITAVQQNVEVKWLFTVMFQECPT